MSDAQTETIEEKESYEASDAIAPPIDLSDDPNLADARSVGEDNLSAIRADEQDGESQETLERIGKRKPWSWKNPFHAPEPREGFRQKWFKTTLNNGEPDDTLHDRMETEGFKVRKHSTLTTDEKKRFRSRNSAGFKGVIVSSRMILCERPQWMSDDENYRWEKEDLDRVNALHGLEDIEGMDRFEGFGSEIKQRTQYYS